MSNERQQISGLYDNNSSFWPFYLCAVGIALLGMGWMVLSGTVLWEFFLGETMKPDAYSGYSALLAERELRYGLPGDSILASLSILGTAWFSILVYLFPAAPSLAAILIVWRNRGSAGVQLLFSRFKPVLGGIKLREAGWLYLAVIGGIVAFALAYLSLTGLIVEGGFEKGWQGMRLDTPVFAFFFMLLGITTSHGALLEELGWRGYAWPLLIERMQTPLKAALFLGVLWAAWHLPREVIMLFGGASPLTVLANQLDFFVSITAVTVIICYAVNRSGGSILPAILIHGANNYLQSCLEPPVIIGSLNLFTLMEVAVAVVLVSIVGVSLGWREAPGAVNGRPPPTSN